jgi:hypothetical protein
VPDEEYTGTHRKPDEPEAPDTGPETGPDMEPDAEADPSEPLATLPNPDSGLDSGPESEPDSEPESEEETTAPSERRPAPGQYHYLKRWTFVLVLIAVWLPAALIGLGLYYWWYHSIDKTPAVFVVMVYVIVCTVGALLTAMVEHKPRVSAIAVALLSAPFWSVTAAAVLHGVYFCEHARRCLVGLIPY